ncbi:hypothetical protein ACHAWF_003650, partial [Thalassiosira exigua]
AGRVSFVLRSVLVELISSCSSDGRVGITCSCAGVLQREGCRLVVPRQDPNLHRFLPRNTMKPLPCLNGLIMKSTLAVLLAFSACAMMSTDAFCPNNINYGTSIKTQLKVQSSLQAAVEGRAGENGASDSRRGFLASAAAALAVVVSNPAVSNAAYGEDAKIQIPDIVQGMTDRANKQCLVESLGNRECLVYLEDPENLLYKGSDAQILFVRLGNSMTALKDLPQYIESKEWNKVQGVLTGPMGILSSTMNELVKIAGGNSGLKKLSVDIRNDLYAISGAVDRKSGIDALSAFERAESKLDKFATLVNGS